MNGAEKDAGRIISLHKTIPHTAHTHTSRALNIPSLRAVRSCSCHTIQNSNVSITREIKVIPQVCVCVGEDDLIEATHRGDLVQIPEIAFHKMRTISVMQRSYVCV